MGRNLGGDLWGRSWDGGGLRFGGVKGGTKGGLWGREGRRVGGGRNLGSVGGGDPRDLLGAKGGSPGVEGKDGGHCYEGGGGAQNGRHCLEGRDFRP